MVFGGIVGLGCLRRVEVGNAWKPMPSELLLAFVLALAVALAGAHYGRCIDGEWACPPQEAPGGRQQQICHDTRILVRLTEGRGYAMICPRGYSGDFNSGEIFRFPEVEKMERWRVTNHWWSDRIQNSFLAQLKDNTRMPHTVKMLGIGKGLLCSLWLSQQSDPQVRPVVS